MLMALRRYSDLVGKPLHACAAELIERGLSRVEQLEVNQHKEKQEPRAAGLVPAANGDQLRDTQPCENAEHSEPGRSAGQMELFAG